jgi:predicted amino acid dehydrogenase
MPRFRWYFYWAEVLLGGMQHLRRYAPDKLSGKIVFTNLTNDDDLEFLRNRDVATVVGLLPRINERRVSTGLLELMLKQLLHGKDTEGDWEAAFLNFFARHRFAPEIESFHAEPDVEPALIDISVTADLPGPKPAPAEEYEAAADGDGDEEGRFAFVVHPLVYGQLRQHPVLRSLDRMMPSAWLEELAPVVVPAPVIGTIKNIVSATGARARGYIYAIPSTPKMMLKYPPERTYRRIIQITRHAERLGAGIVGLGAFTSVVGDAGVTVARRSRIGITTGNSFTVAVTIRTLAQAADLMGIELNQASACVIGATGSIGSIICHLLASEVHALTLVSPRPERLLGLSNNLRERFPDIELDIARAPDEALGRADIVITTTSAVGSVVKMPLLKPGAVVSDVARPPDISPKAAAERPDVLVIESGEVQLFPGARLTADLGLPEGVIYACLAETILLALEKHYDHFTLGREISEERVRHISELADKHGMKLAAIRSFGNELSDEDILAVRQRAEDARKAASGEV